MCNAMGDASFKADEKVRLSLLVKNCAGKDAESVDDFEVTHVTVISADGKVRVDSNERFVLKPSATVKRSFEFASSEEDVKQGRVVFGRVELTLHNRVRLCYNLPTEESPRAKDFFPALPAASKLASSDVTDDVSIDLETLPVSLPASVGIDQRQPLLKVRSTLLPFNRKTSELF